MEPHLKRTPRPNFHISCSAILIKRAMFFYGTIDQVIQTLYYTRKNCFHFFSILKNRVYFSVFLGAIPSKIKKVTGTRWFLLFVDNHTRVWWVFLMKDKSETTSVLKNFHPMIQTQFSAQIHVLRTDRDSDYFNSVLGSYLTSQGIVHRSSCVNTPQQNGVVERKNRHLLEYTRSFLFTYKVPSHFWGEALFSTTYLINCMASSVLNYKTPIETLCVHFPLTHLLNSIPPKICRCCAFVHIHSQHRGKLEPRAIKCIFLGYSPNYKSYKCYSPITKKFYHSTPSSKTNLSTPISQFKKIMTQTKNFQIGSCFQETNHVSTSKNVPLKVYSTRIVT